MIYNYILFYIYMIYNYILFCISEIYNYISSIDYFIKIS